jgi:5-formyltetrahydrofolate cyclo-ligase
MDEKKNMRAQIAGRRAAMVDTERVRQSGQVAQILSTVPEIRSAKIVGLYCAARGEMSCQPLADNLKRLGCVIVYPRVIDLNTRAMEFAHAKSDAAFRPGHYGIPEPRGASVDLASIDVVVLPGLGFDAQGVRLGYGAGYYDRLMPRMPRALRVGIGFDEQLVPTLPFGSHDIFMDMVVTAQGIVYCGARVKSSRAVGID